MSQIPALNHREPEVTLTIKEKRRLEVWPEDDGWCSACGRGRHWSTRGTVPVVHIGSKKRAVDVAFCRPCIERLHAATQQTGKGEP